MKAVRFDHYGDISVLHVDEVELRAPASNEVVVKVHAAGINPGEASIRKGALHDRFPATFPSGQGTDLAGTVTDVGGTVTEWAAGDEVLGWSWERSSQAELVVVPSDQLVAKPADLDWDVAGALCVAGCTAWAAVDAVNAHEGDTVGVSAAAGGVGSITVQLLRLRNADVIAITSDRHADWLRRKGATVVDYGEGLKDRLSRYRLTAFLDLFGPEYVQLAVDLGVSPDRINTIIGFAAAAQLGTKTEGSANGTRTDVLAELARLAAGGKLEVPIAHTYPLDQVQEAFRDLEERHTLGKIVLRP